MWPRLACAAVVELTYCIVTRTWLRAHFEGIELELWTTAGRLASLVVFLLLFRSLIFSRSPKPNEAAHPLALGAIALVLLTPVAVGNYALPNTATQVVFAVASLAVALKEEALYRGVLQNIIETRYGLLASIVVSNLVFTLYHYGAQPFTLLNLTEIFAAGCILGLLYARTGSLGLVVGLHAVNDAIWSFTPLLSSPLPRPLGSTLLLAALGLCVMWAVRSNRRCTSLDRNAVIL